MNAFRILPVVAATALTIAAIQAPARADLPSTISNFSIVLGTGASRTLPMSPTPSTGPAPDSYTWTDTIITSSLPQPLNFVGGGYGYGLVVTGDFLDANQHVVYTQTQGVYSFSRTANAYFGPANSLSFPMSISWTQWGIFMAVISAHQLNPEYIRYSGWISGRVSFTDLINGQAVAEDWPFSIGATGSPFFTGYYRRPTTGWPKP